MSKERYMENVLKYSLDEIQCYTLLSFIFKCYRQYVNAKDNKTDQLMHLRS